jgi:hypothetical protein
MKADPYQKQMLDYIFAKKLKKSDQKLTSFFLDANSISDDPENKLVLATVQISRSNLRFSDANSQLEFEIKQGDLLKEKVDVIVNAANAHLNLGGELFM